MTTELRERTERLLGEVIAGKPEAREALIGHVYEQLHAMACRQLGRWRAGHSWGATDLVHEAYLQLFKKATPGKLAERPPEEWRRYFFGAAANAMRQLLVAHAPRVGRARMPVEDLAAALEESQQVSIEDLDRALKDLEAFAPREHQIVMLRVFAGLRVSEVAAQLGVGVSTVEKDWRWARAWLYTRLRGSDHDA